MTKVCKQAIGKMDQKAILSACIYPQSTLQIRLFVLAISATVMHGPQDQDQICSSTSLFDPILHSECIQCWTFNGDTTLLIEFHLKEGQYLCIWQAKMPVVGFVSKFKAPLSTPEPSYSAIPIAGTAEMDQYARFSHKKEAKD